MKYKKLSTVVTALSLLGGVSTVVGSQVVGSNFINNVSGATVDGQSTTVTDSTGRVTFTVTPIYDGTGFGTSGACQINSSNGYPQGDNNANDGVVCSGDQIGYRIDYNVAASDTPTVINFTPSGVAKDLDGNTAMQTPTSVMDPSTIPLTPWCTGGTGLIHTGKDNGNRGCTMTFPASASSGTSSFTTYANMNRDPSTDFDYNLRITLTDEKGQNPRILDSPKTRVINVPDVDPTLVRASDPVYKVVNGVGGMYTEWRVVYNGIIGGGANNRKGTYSTDRKLIGNFNIDMSSFPKGTTVNTPNGWTYSNGNLSADNYSFNEFPAFGWLSVYDKNWPVSSGADGNGKYSTNFSTFVPTSTYDTSKDQQWDMHITKADIKTANTNTQVFPNNLNGQEEPGLNQSSTYNTANIRGSYSERGAQGSDNNDWVKTKISADVTGSGNMTKLDRLDVGGQPDFSSDATKTIYKLDQKYWSDIMLKPATSKTSNIALCDTFSKKGTSGGQKYDSTRTPVVTWWDSKSGKQVNRGYKIYYGTSIFQSNINDNNSFNRACGNDQDTKWTDTPNDDTNVVKVVMDGDQDWAVDSDVAGRVTLPFTAFDINSYPDNSNGKYALQDFAAISNGGGNNTWNGFTGSLINVGVTSYDWDGRFGSHHVYAGATTPTAYNNGILVNSGYHDTTDPSEFKTKLSINISSCVSSFNVPQDFKDLYDYTITPADFGPDGLACTADDVSDWKIETGEIKKGSPNDQPANDQYIWSFGKNTNSSQWNVTIPAYVKGGTTVPIRTTTTITNIKEKTTRNNVGGEDIIVDASSTVGQSKLTTTPLKQVGQDLSWTLSWFNTSKNDVGQGQFIDVLPYNGDKRGTKMTGKLSNIRLESLPSTTGVNYYVTTANPKTIVADAGDASNQSGGSTKWCAYTDKTCIGGDEITAIKIVQDKLASGYIGGVKVTANTVGNSDNDILENNLGVGKVDGFTLGVPTTSIVENALYDTKVSGNVYWDANDNGKLDTDENRRFSGAKIQILDTSGSVVKETTSIDNGTWSVSGLPLGNYTAQLVDRGGKILSKWTQTEGTDPTNVTLSLTSKSKDDINYGFYLKVNPGLKITKTAEGYENGGNVVTGTRVTWDYTVTNTGDTTVNNVKVTDSKGVNVVCPESSIEPGKSMVCKGTGVVSAA